MCTSHAYVFIENIKEGCEVKIEMDDKNEKEDEKKTEYLLAILNVHAEELFSSLSCTKAQCKEATFYKSAFAQAVQGPPPEALLA